MGSKTVKNKAKTMENTSTVLPRRPRSARPFREMTAQELKAQFAKRELTFPGSVARDELVRAATRFTEC